MKKILLIITSLFSIVLLTYFLFIGNKKKEGIDHIFLIIIDTLRADHLGCYGYPRNTSPFIDSLANKGILFEKAYSQSSTTCPSVASMMTGLYLSQHKVVRNGYVLDDSHVTIAETLEKEGYKTAAFTSTDRHFLASNINQGFGFYEEPLNTIETYGYKYRPARLTINNSMMWLDNFNAKDKLFLWIHLFDPHLPYHPPKEFYMKMDESISRNEFMNFIDKFKISMEVFGHNKENVYQELTKYDAEISYVDDQIKRFFDFVRRKGLDGKSLWVITSDHGEGLGQHRWLQHARMLYQEEIHVPLVFYFGNRKMDSKRVKEVVEVFDINRTIIDLLGLKLDKKELQDAQSSSLVPLIHGKNKDWKAKYAFAEREWYSEKVKFNEDVPEWDRNWEPGEKYCIQNNKFKYIFRTDQKDKLFSLENDPYEIINLNDEPELIPIKDIMRKEINNFIFIFEKYKKGKLKIVDENTLKKLKSLGYVF